MRELNFIYRPEFWESYNVTKDMPLDEGIIEELGLHEFGKSDIQN